ncbi:hypothetical protein Tco_1198519, partial [Tanacetum coccineum]
DLDLPLEEADVPSFSDDSILRGIESDHDSGEDTTSIDDLSLDDSIILSEYESFTFDDEPVMAEVNVFDEINTSELSYPGIGENVVLDEEEDTFTITTRTFLPFVTYPEVLPASYSTGSEDKNFNPGFSRFSGFWMLHGSKLWKDKAIPAISIDGLQSSLHKWENSYLLSLILERILKSKRAKTTKNRQETEETSTSEDKRKKIKAGSADNKKRNPRAKVVKVRKLIIKRKKEEWNHKD